MQGTTEKYHHDDDDVVDAPREADSNKLRRSLIEVKEGSTYKIAFLDGNPSGFYASFTFDEGDTGQRQRAFRCKLRGIAKCTNEMENDFMKIAKQQHLLLNLKVCSVKQMEDTTAVLLTVDMKLVYGMEEKEEVNMLTILTSLGHVVNIAHLKTETLSMKSDNTAVRLLSQDLTVDKSYNIMYGEHAEADLVLDDIAVVFECPATENAITMLKRLQLDHEQHGLRPPGPVSPGDFVAVLCGGALFRAKCISILSKEISVMFLDKPGGKTVSLWQTYRLLPNHCSYPAVIQRVKMVDVQLYDGFDCEEGIAKALKGSHNLIAKFGGAEGGKILATLYMSKKSKMKQIGKHFMKKQKSKAQKDMPGCVREAAVVSPIEVVVESEGQYRNADKYYQTAAASHSYCLTAEGDSTNQQLSREESNANVSEKNSSSGTTMMSNDARANDVDTETDSDPESECVQPVERNGREQFEAKFTDKAECSVVEDFLVSLPELPFDHFKGIIKGIDGSGTIWVLPESRITSMDKLLHNITKMSNIESPLTVAKGDIFVYKDPKEKGSAHRVMIVEMLTHDIYRAARIDSNCERELVAMQHLIKVPASIKDIPIILFPVQVYGVTMFSATGEVYEHLKCNFPKMEVAVQVKVGTPLYPQQAAVYMLDQNKENKTASAGLNLALILIQFGSDLCTSLKNWMITVNGSGLDTWIRGTKVETLDTALPAVLPFETGMAFPFRVTTFIKEDNSLDIQPYFMASSDNLKLSKKLRSELVKTERLMFNMCSWFDELKKLLKRSAESEKASKKKRDWNVGDPVNAFYQEEESPDQDEWARGEIVSVDRNEKMAEIRFTDYGNSERIPFRNLRALPSDQQKEPVNCINVRFLVPETVAEVESVFNSLNDPKLLPFFARVKSVNWDPKDWNSKPLVNIFHLQETADDELILNKLI